MLGSSLSILVAIREGRLGAIEKSWHPYGKIQRVSSGSSRHYSLCLIVWSRQFVLFNLHLDQTECCSICCSRIGLPTKMDMSSYFGRSGNGVSFWLVVLITLTVNDLVSGTNLGQYLVCMAIGNYT